MKYTSRRLLLCGLAALSICAATTAVSAATIVAAKTDSLDHNQTNSAFFTASSNNSVTLAAADGWAPVAPAQAAAISSVTTKKSYSIAGDSTAAGNWTDGNGVPGGITLAFEAQLTISASPPSPAGSFLTNPGASGGTLGNGIGVTQTSGGNDDIDAGDGITVGAVTVSNVSFTGMLADPNYTFTPGGVSGFGTRVLRSNNFAEATAGMVLTQGADTIGFGTATGTIASNQVIENNLGTGATPSSIFPRQSGPYTLLVTQGTAVIKGIGLGYDVTYDITAVPEPAAGLLAAIGAVALASTTRLKRRVG